MVRDHHDPCATQRTESSFPIPPSEVPGIRWQMLSRDRPALSWHGQRATQPCRGAPARRRIVLRPDMRQGAKALVSLLENDRTSLVLDSGGVTAENLCARSPSRKSEQAVRVSQSGTRREPNEILGVWQGIRLVKIIDAPDQPLLRIAPGPKVVEVQISNRRDDRRFREFGILLPLLTPPRKGSSKQSKPALRHLRVLAPEGTSIDRRLLGEPRLISPKTASNSTGFVQSGHEAPYPTRPTRRSSWPRSDAPYRP